MFWPGWQSQPGFSVFMDPEPEPIRIPITDVFDLHSVPPRDVKPVVEEYLAEAHRMGLKALRLSTAAALACSGSWYGRFWPERISWPPTPTPRSKPEAGEPRWSR